MMTAHRWLAVDPLHEAAHMLRIQLLLAAGDVREAITQYDHYAARLSIEMGMAPSAALTASIEDAKDTRRRPAGGNGRSPQRDPCRRP